MNKRHYEHTLPNIRGSLSNTYKLQLIEKISRQAVALVLLAGICLLYNKGIVPVYTIVLFLFSGTIIGFFFRALSFVIKIILVLLLAGMFV